MNRINAIEISPLLESTASIEKDSPSTTIYSIIHTGSVLYTFDKGNLTSSIKPSTHLKERSVKSKSPVLAHKQLVKPSLYLVEESNATNILTSYACANDIFNENLPVLPTRCDAGEVSEASTVCRSKCLGTNINRVYDQHSRFGSLELNKSKIITSIKKRKLTIESLTASTNHKEIIDDLIRKQKFLNIDKTSYETMIESIKFAGINTLKEAQDLNLRIIPPGPVFHTWWARYGTGIFDGDNNPFHAKGLNYVQRIEEQAERLKQWQIPVFVVYIEYNMIVSELIKMRTLFKKHDNIIMLSLEKDLPFITYYTTYYSSDKQSMLDNLRYEICREFPAVLDKVKEKTQSKLGYLERLNSLGGNSIIYSDIDNTFIRRPQYQIVSNGFRQASVINKEFRITNDEDKHYMDATVVNHRSYFSHEGFYCEKLPSFSADYLLSMADSLYNYLLSGKALDVYRKIKCLPSHYTPIAFYRDVGYMSIDRKSLDDSEKKTDSTIGIDWVYSLMIPQNSDIKVSYMLVMQQIKQLHNGRDLTWYCLPT